jgi:hypothetical protein
MFNDPLPLPPIYSISYKQPINIFKACCKVPVVFLRNILFIS